MGRSLKSALQKSASSLLQSTVGFTFNSLAHPLSLKFTSQKCALDEDGMEELSPFAALPSANASCCRRREPHEPATGPSPSFVHGGFGPDSPHAQKVRPPARPH